jgi:hypothetical protein
MDADNDSNIHAPSPERYRVQATGRNKARSNGQEEPAPEDPTTMAAGASSVAYDLAGAYASINLSGPHSEHPEDRPTDMHLIMARDVPFELDTMAANILIIA